LYASITTWLLIISYLVILVTLPGVPDNVVINNVLFLVTANLLGMVASYSIEFYMKADYIKSKRLQEKTSIIKVELDRKSRELESARQIQMSMLPQALPYHPLIDLSVSMKTASEIGGDYYDYHLDDDDTLTFAIGDATGHGAQAGAMVTALKVLFSNYASQLDITEFMEKADMTIKQIKLPRLYMSLAVGRLTGNILEITGVGMPPLMIYRARTNTIERINLKGLPLGSFMELKYIKETTELFPGDSLLLMTDGFPELFNKEREMFGYDRIEQVFHNEAKYTPEKVNKRFNDISEEWMRDFTQMDDVTVMVMKMKKTAVRNSSLVDLSTLIMNRMS
jgi:serine phosphatase RsbU (regulator of sigma subunit)